MRYLTIIFILLLPCLTYGGWFGNNTEDYSNSTDIEDQIKSTWVFSPDSAGVLDTIKALIKITIKEKDLRAAIYNAWAHIIDTSEVYPNKAYGDSGWVSFVMVMRPTLNPDSVYALCVWADADAGDAVVYYTAQSGQNIYYDAEDFANSWPATLGTLPAHANQEACIYCIYHMPSAGTDILHEMGETPNPLHEKGGTGSALHEK